MSHSKEPCKYLIITKYQNLSYPIYLTITTLAFEKYFTVNSPEVITDYTKLQQQKFVILYALFVEKYREQQDNCQ